VAQRRTCGGDQDEGGGRERMIRGQILGALLQGRDPQADYLSLWLSHHLCRSRGSKVCWQYKWSYSWQQCSLGTGSGFQAPSSFCQVKTVCSSTRQPSQAFLCLWQPPFSLAHLAEIFDSRCTRCPSSFGKRFLDVTCCHYKARSCPAIPMVEEYIPQGCAES